MNDLHSYRLLTDMKTGGPIIQHMALTELAGPTETYCEGKYRLQG